MQAYARSSTGSAPDRDAGRAPRPSAPRSATAARLAHLQATAGNAAVVHAVQRDRHQHTAGCGHVDEETAAPLDSAVQREAVVQRDSVADAVRSPWSPLEPRVKKRAEAGLGIDLSGVRVHTGDVAQRSAQRYGARAYTSGLDIVVGPQGVDDETMYHEVTHVWQQAGGPVAGTDTGDGTKVSSPGDPFERHATDSGRKLAQGIAPDTTRPATGGGGAGTAPVQRYQVIEPGQEGYPTKHPDADDEQFFVGQDMNEAGSWYDQDSPPVPHLVYEGAVRLAVSDDFSLAVQHAAGGKEPKTFFATNKRISSSNERLPDLTRGRGVRLEKTGRYLTFEGMGRKEVLYEVQPKGRPSRRDNTVQHGLDVRVPQRCNAMAEFVTGQKSVDLSGGDAYWETLGKALDRLTSGNKYEKRIKKAFKDGDTDVAGPLMLEMSGLFQQLVAAQPEEVERVLQRLEINEHAKMPKVGDAMMVKAEADAAQLEDMQATGNRPTPFHFGGVVAKAGDDYVTMENYAREQPSRSTLDGGDPLWYFRMYGRQAGRTWHECWTSPESASFVGAMLTITLRG
ncbi:DUF4157 domain-containing protein [Streptomyces sp. NPDC048385]|uniref:eCIS core domain-containing protein n=1 Tax=unclassified Streptomyces TaxID=2593676 RepID=UPI00342BB5BA